MASQRMTLTLGADDWARTRFVHSRLWETAQAVRTLTRPRRQLHHRAWVDTVGSRDAVARLPVLAALNPAVGWVPDFLAPPPQPGLRTIEDELAEVARYPGPTAAADVKRSLDSHPTRARRAVLEPLIEDPTLAMARIVDELRWAWFALLAPFWSPVDELVGDDIAYRSRRVARGGLGRMLEELHSSVSWRDGTVFVDHTEELTIDLAGQGLALMPSAFVWPAVIVVHDHPWPPTLVYPARGIGELWTAPPAPAPGLVGVLGRTRALLLTDLGRPATTTVLARRHALSPAAVSTQLQRLHEAGLVSARRTGKEVHYRRTPAADALVTAPSVRVPVR